MTMRMSTNPSHAPNQPRKHVLITGGSSGIGAALALAYAKEGALVSLQGRNLERLRRVAAHCVEEGGATSLQAIDVRERDALRAWLLARDDSQPIDLLIANAGIAGAVEASPNEAPPIDAGGIVARTIVEINLLGLIDTVEALLPRFQTRRSGQLALMASLAAYRGYAAAPAYAASKAAIHIYGQGLRARLRPLGIAVSTIYPGFVDTPLTRDNPFPMPFMMSVERAARLIKTGLDQRRPKIVFPWTTFLLAKLAAGLPDRLVDRLMSRTVSKEPGP
ncbi:SDR family NAD(P)-dependent oxidoreductase [Arboricoccus pini]|nr:SDR family NAD(P)-dependent oxidoreductase [Arboricoccus pini]